MVDAADDARRIWRIRRGYPYVGRSFVEEGTEVLFPIEPLRKSLGSSSGLVSKSSEASFCFGLLLIALNGR
jgi:hypothetical protein